MGCSYREAHTIFCLEVTLVVELLSMWILYAKTYLVLPFPRLVRDVICLWLVLCRTFKWLNPLLLHLLILVLKLICPHFPQDGLFRALKGVIWLSFIRSAHWVGQVWLMRTTYPRDFCRLQLSGEREHHARSVGVRDASPSRAEHLGVNFGFSPILS